MAIAGKRDPLPPRDPQYVSRCWQCVRCRCSVVSWWVGQVNWLGDLTFQQQLVGGDWNHGLLWLSHHLGNGSHHPNWLSVHHFSEGLVGIPPTRAKLGMYHPANLRISPWFLTRKTEDLPSHWWLIPVFGGENSDRNVGNFQSDRNRWTLHDFTDEDGM